MKSWTATSAAGPGKTECGMENCHKADRVLSSGTVPSATYRRDVVPCSVIKRCCGSPVAVILSVVMSLTGCGGGQRSGAEETGTAQPVPVKALRIEQEQNISSLTYVGTVRASRSTVLSCRYSGNLVSLNVSQGQHVSKGDTVAVVNSQSVISMRDMALATLDQAEDGYERARTVHESGSMADVKWVEVQTQLAKAEASAAAARKAYEDCTVKAPYSGVIGEVYADEGVELNVSEPIVRLMDISSLEIGFSVPESEMGDISEGMAVTVVVPALGDRQFGGRITVRGVSASVLSHSYSCTLVPDGKVEGLLPGMVCKVRTGKDVPGITVPASVVMTGMDGKYVWTVKDGKAAKSPIVTGGFAGNGVVVTSGLEPGDVVIVEGAHKVSTGMPVKILE